MIKITMYKSPGSCLFISIHIPVKTWLAGKPSGELDFQFLRTQLYVIVGIRFADAELNGEKMKPELN